MKTLGWETVLIISKQLFSEVSLIMHFYSFEQRSLKIKKFKTSLNKQHKDIKLMVFNFFLPCLGKFSLNLRTRVGKTIARDLSYCKPKVIFRSKCQLSILFLFKDLFEKMFCSRMIFSYTCSNWKCTYYGKTFRHFIPEWLKI